MFKSKYASLSGSDYKEVYKKARFYYDEIASATRRRAAIKSVFFQKQKIFLDIFWSHLHQKKAQDRVRRLKLYPCALDLLRHCTDKPTSQHDTNDASVLLHRFFGESSDGRLFCVQVKEQASGKKYMLSVFPYEI